LSLLLASEWVRRLRHVTPGPDIQVLEGRGGRLTVRTRQAFLHSQYNPEQEAQRLIDAAELDSARPVLVVGLGLAYHVIELINRGFEVVVLEPNVELAALSVRMLPQNIDFHVGIGTGAELCASPKLQEYLRAQPQLLVHPPTGRLYPEFQQEIAGALAYNQLSGQRLNVAVVGPLYGGSLPIAQYLVRGLRTAGHNATLIDNAPAWELYREMTGSVKNAHASGQLGQLMANTLSEWTYARVMEFDPEICIVLAQAPVNTRFPARLREAGIVTAYWFVENWRHMGYWRDIAELYDTFFHIQPGEFESKLASVGVKHQAFVQTACDPELHRPVRLSEPEKRAYKCDISFAGAGYYNRLQVFKGLTDFDFRIWGVDWNDRDLAPLVQGGERRFDSEDFNRIVSGSKVNLNLHSSKTHDGVDPACDALNPRIFEIAAAGGFQVCDPCAGLAQHFDPQREVPQYRDLRELREILRYYLEHPKERSAMARRSRDRALREHTYGHRAAQMIERLTFWHGARILAKGVRIQRTVAETASRLPQESALRVYLETLPPDLLFTQDAINAVLRPPMAGLTYPEQLFSYMREVRNFSETLLKEHR